MSDARQIAAALLDGSEGLKGFLSRHPSKTNSVIRKVISLGFKQDHVQLTKVFGEGKSTNVKIFVKVLHEPNLNVAPRFHVDYIERQNGQICSDYGLYLRATPAVLRAFEVLVKKLTSLAVDERNSAWLGFAWTEFNDNTRT